MPKGTTRQWHPCLAQIRRISGPLYQKLFRSAFRTNRVDGIARFGRDQARAMNRWELPQEDARFATADECDRILRHLACLVYRMGGAPEVPAAVGTLLVTEWERYSAATVCSVCLGELEFADLLTAGSIEVAHDTPKLHTATNVGFAHKACNRAQSDMTVDEFRVWLIGAVGRIGNSVKSFRDAVSAAVKSDARPRLPWEGEIMSYPLAA